MNDEIFSFCVGNFKCTAVCDGTFTYAPPTFPPPEVFLFANAPKPLLAKLARTGGWERERWVSPYICLLIDTGKNLILVDTGAGDLGPETGKLPRNLKAAGITPEEIDIIVITHAHPDHVGGITDHDGNPIYTKAEYYISRDEWLFWNSEEATRQIDEHFREVLVGYARKNLQPVANRLQLMETEPEIVPGIKMIAAQGHTPGHTCLSISSAGERLLYLSDTVLHPVNIEHPEWFAAVDLFPEKTVVSRHKILEAAAAQRTMVLAFHFPFPGLGYINKRDDGLEWQPMGN